MGKEKYIFEYLEILINKKNIILVIIQNPTGLVYSQPYRARLLGHPVWGHYFKFQPVTFHNP